MYTYHSHPENRLDKETARYRTRITFASQSQASRKLDFTKKQQNTEPQALTQAYERYPEKMELDEKTATGNTHVRLSKDI
ncbi:hypothetical protein KIN20_020254 [Parelaphostrongylus tenuis]|uniref:Uncharacterized protein n=1 Tax=Parelaphostrongylus tenuis TaxID=148309 RepID=A0AAD5QT42_PARTN|nr:hypothetical protein KIN20_020254 [Parelaphostrongylus tenuis]